MAVVVRVRKQMKLNRIGRLSMALAASVALGLSMTACGGGTVGYMWVVGTQSTSSMANSIVGFKIDDYSGNLTTSPKSPFSSAGTNPSTLLVRPGGRFVYVINTGSVNSAVTPPTGITTGIKSGGNISAFSVGGDGTLTFQETYSSQGGTPVWASMDSAGAYLYVLDSLAPVGSSYYTAGVGDVTVFSIASDTGRLTLVTNQQTKDENNINLNYFPVGPDPTMMKISSTGCLFIVDKNQNTDANPTYVFPYQVASGQLTQTVNSQIATGASHISSINVGGGNGTGTSVGGTYVYATDLGPADNSGNSTGNGFILAYTVGTNCALNAVVGSPFGNIPPGQNPVWAQTEARGGFLYVLNQTSTNSAVPSSSISAFKILSTTGQLTMVPDGQSNPYAIGSGPTCMAEDPTNQYLYTSNSVDGNVTGKLINSTSGQLSDLARGSKFTAVTHASCLAISGAVD